MTQSASRAMTIVKTFEDGNSEEVLNTNLFMQDWLNTQSNFYVTSLNYYLTSSSDNTAVIYNPDVEPRLYKTT